MATKKKTPTRRRTKLDRLASEARRLPADRRQQLMSELDQDGSHLRAIVDADPELRTFTLEDIAKTYGVSVRSLLRPCVQGQNARRHGYRGRVWSLLDVLVVDLVRQLREHGLSLQAIRRGIVRLEHDHGLTKALHQALDPMTPVVLVLQGDDLLLLDGDAAWSVIRERGQSIILNKAARRLGDAAVKLYTENVIIYRSINEPTVGSAAGV